MLSTLRSRLRPLRAGLAGGRELARQPQRIRAMMYDAYIDAEKRRGRVPVVPLREVAPLERPVLFQPFEPRYGNMGSGEVLAVAALCASRRPLRVLEIGTFWGVTTLHLALNAPEDAVVYTLDLPPSTVQTALTAESWERAYIEDGTRHASRAYATSGVAHKITELTGDSAHFPLHEHGPFDFVFVDGSHSYDYVRNDTEKIMPLLSPRAIVVWHDFSPTWPGVWRYLNDMSARLPLRAVQDTTLAVYRAP
jgi:predicted O-methyltransferase YrrM